MTTRDHDGQDELAQLLKEVRRIEVQSRRLASGVMAGGYLSVFRGAGIEFDAVREYVPGDDPRSVDWNVTARAGRPFVKKYVDERDLSVVFLLDLSASMTGGFGPWSARQTAARICACLALSAVKNGDKVGLIAFSDGVDKHLPPKKGIAHALRIVRDALALPAGGAVTRFEPPLELAKRVLRRRSVVFLVSDFLGVTVREGVDAIASCARRHDVVAVRLLVPELAPPDCGPMRIRDPETGHERVVDWRDARTRTEFRARVARWQATVCDELRRAGVDRMDVRVPRSADPDAIARPILEFFRTRELRSAHG